MRRGGAFWLGLALCGLLGRAAFAQGYGEQSTLPFSFVGQSDSVRLSIESTRQSISNLHSGSSSAGVSTAGTLTPTSQTGSDLNNVVQYYNNSTTTISVTGSSNTISSGGVLNAGQNSTGTSQVLNNSTQANSNNPTTNTTNSSTTKVSASNSVLNGLQSK